MSTKLKGKNRYYHMLDLPGSMPSTGLIQCHREMAQRMLKRTLLPNECVVRKDGDRNNNNIDNLMVFATKGGARRYYSKYKQEFLFRREDGVYDYDWEAIKQQKNKVSENHKNKMEKIKERNEKINIFIKNNPNCTLSEIANTFFNGKEATARSHLNTHNIKLNSINYNNSNKGVEKLRSMTRNELMSYLNIHHVSGHQLAKAVGAEYYSVTKTLSDRGLSTVGKHKKFKHLTRQAIIDAMASHPSKQQLARILDVFEENLEVEMWRLGIKTNFRMSFVRDNYEMPKEEDYENSNTKIDKHEKEMDVVEHEKLVDDAISEVQGKEFDNFNTMLDINKENKFTFDDAYGMGLTFNDIKFITNTSTQELSKFESININMDDVNKLLQMKKVLTKENMIALYKAGHSTSDISNIYKYDVDFVRHIAGMI